MQTRLKWIYLFTFAVYVILRAFTNLDSIQKPRELNDTISYLRISQDPLNFEFFNAPRPFVFPLFLKIANQDVRAAAALQVILSMAAWASLAWIFSASLRTIWLKPVSFGLILAVSLVRHLAGWDYVILTESLSVTFFVAFLAAALWLLQEWNLYKVFLLSFIAFLLAFTRDTNAYLLLMLAGMLGLAVLFRWGERRWLILVAVFAGLFLLNNASSDIGRRWVFPLNNVIGRRILPFADSVSALQACGMPVNETLLGLANSYANSGDRAFYNDPNLEEYRLWLLESGKMCYMKYLLSAPVENTRIVLSEFQSLVAFDKLGNFLARKYDPLIPYFAEPFLYPSFLILPVWALLTLAALFIVYKKHWQRNPLWAVFVLLCLTILPHLFITWHGDAMAPERHALSVGLQLALSFWFVILLTADEYLYIKAANS